MSKDLMSGRLATNMNSHSYRPRNSSWLREVASDDCPASSSTWNSDFGLGQWIGLRDNLQENSGKPHVSWENLWFPVKIFPTKPIHWLGNSQQLFLQKAVHLPMYRSTSLPIHLPINLSVYPTPLYSSSIVFYPFIKLFMQIIYVVWSFLYLALVIPSSRHCIQFWPTRGTRKGTMNVSDQKSCTSGQLNTSG